jgi:hypothetical protein
MIVSCVRLGFASVQIRNPAHGKPGKIGHKNAFSSGDRDRQCADRRRLVNDQQELPVLL